MKLFVYEWLSAGGAGGDAPVSLCREGWAMLAALAHDFQRVPGVHVTTLLHESMGESLGHECRRIAFDEERTAFREQLAGCDAALVVAPETGGILAQRSRDVLDAGKTLLGSTPAAVERTADKLALAEYLAAHGVPTPATIRANDSGGSDLPFPIVCKPRHGAGSQATFLVHDGAQLRDALDLARQDLAEDECVVQPYVAGQAASAAFLIGPRQTLALAPATQRLSTDGRFHYLGGTAPLEPRQAGRAVSLAARALSGIEGLHGFVGVDLILGPDGDHVIEINPRPTTSYIGLSELALDNLADVWLRLAHGEEVSPPALARHAGFVDDRDGSFTNGPIPAMMAVIRKDGAACVSVSWPVAARAMPAC